MRGNMPGEFTDVSEWQMRRWEISSEIQERVGEEQASCSSEEPVLPYIAMARQCCAGGREIAAIAAKKFSFELLDKQILEHIAAKHGWSKEMLAAVDERRPHWLLEAFGNWTSQRVVSQSTYVWGMGQIVRLAARSTRCIFVGRGAHYMLPRQRGLVVWVIAPFSRRIERAMQRWELAEPKARKRIETVDAERRTFVQRFFRRDLRDPHLYDLVVNTEHVTLDDAADLIVREYFRRFGENPD